MVKNIIWIVIVAVIGVPSWQIGSIMLEKKKTSYMLQEQANSAKKYYQKHNLIKRYLKENLEAMDLPTDFTFKALKPKKVEIGYTYHGAATIFGYTYYEKTEDIQVVTEDGTWDNEL